MTILLARVIAPSCVGSKRGESSPSTLGALPWFTLAPPRGARVPESSDYTAPQLAEQIADLFEVAGRMSRELDDARDRHGMALRSHPSEQHKSLLMPGCC